MMTMPTRVFIVHFSTSLASRIFTKINEIGLMKAGYVWILTNGIADQLSSINKTGIEAMQGVLGVKTFRKSKELEKFRARWRKMFPEMELNAFGLWAYDAVTALAIAIEEAGTNNMSFSNVDLGENVSELEARSQFISIRSKASSDTLTSSVQRMLEIFVFSRGSCNHQCLRL